METYHVLCEGRQYVTTSFMEAINFTVFLQSIGYDVRHFDTFNENEIPNIIAI